MKIRYYALGMFGLLVSQAAHAAVYFELDQRCQQHWRWLRRLL